ncbi:MAG: LLM class flavin-dependent oxidoreductase [Nitrospinae bacterium]|nr:LLM class flavin-dependent oxidoreductase [Nitrospinota bacterium]
MDVGVVFLPLPGTPVGRSRLFHDWMRDAETMLTTVAQVGFRYIAFTHSYQYGGMQPFVTMARLAPAAGTLRMATQVLLLPLLNAADVAYNVVTLDHICEGRLDLGIGIAYHLRELELGGITRRERVPKFEEALDIMKKFWTGEEVHHQGHYVTIHGTQMGLTPYQQPHPPIWIAAHSHGAATRAGRLGDGIVVGPRVDHHDVTALVHTFRQEWQQCHTEPPTRIGAWREIFIGTNPQDALERGLQSGFLTFRRYQEGAMQERSTVRLRLTLQGDASEWAILGNYQDILEGLARCQDKIGLTHVTCRFQNLPDDRSARLEYLQSFGEEVIQKLRT